MRVVLATREIGSGTIYRSRKQHNARLSACSSALTTRGNGAWSFVILHEHCQRAINMSPHSILTFPPTLPVACRRALFFSPPEALNASASDTNDGSEIYHFSHSQSHARTPFVRIALWLRTTLRTSPTSSLSLFFAAAPRGAACVEQDRVLSLALAGIVVCSAAFHGSLHTLHTAYHLPLIMRDSPATCSLSPSPRTRPTPPRSPSLLAPLASAPGCLRLPLAPWSRQLS